MTGDFTGPIDFDPGPGTHLLTGDADLYLLKLSGAGNFVWAHALSGRGLNTGTNVATDAANNVYVIGSMIDSLNVDPGPGIRMFITENVLFDCFILRFTPEGILTTQYN